MNDFFRYEIETRFTFYSEDEVMKTLPFLKHSLRDEILWETKTYNEDLFKSDRLLRVSDVKWNNKPGSFLGLKESDVGRFCNIRPEIDEEITNGIENSKILKALGIENVRITPQNITEVLRSSGNIQFMLFSGRSLVGKDEERDLSLKLMFCSSLEYPLLLEIEKTADTLMEAIECEKKIYDFVKEYKLFDNVVREEPPTLLYKNITIKE